MGDSQRKKEKGDYNPWTPDETKLLVQLLVDAVTNNCRDSSGTFSKLTVETRILPDLNKDASRPKNYKHYQSRMKYLKQLYQSSVELRRYSSGFGWDPQTKRFTAPNEVWDTYLKAHPTHKNLRYDTFEYIEDLQNIFGEGIATGKNAIGLGDSTDARTYKVGENSNEERVNDQENMYEFDETTHHLESPDHSPVDSQTNSEYKREKFQQKKRARSEKSNSQKDENPMLVVSNQILSIIQQREERQQKEVGQKKDNVWDAIKEVPNLEDRVRYRALTNIYQLGMQNVFISMSVEDRLGWINSSLE